MIATARSVSLSASIAIVFAFPWTLATQTCGRPVAAGCSSRSLWVRSLSVATWAFEVSVALLETQWTGSADWIADPGSPSLYICRRRDAQCTRTDQMLLGMSTSDHASYTHERIAYLRAGILSGCSGP